MKKIILLALAALLIFTMVSCDGNADFLLWGEEEEKYIILEFPNNYGDYSFDSSDTTVKTFKWVLEGNPSTFNDLVGKTVKYYFGDEYIITITEHYGDLYLETTEPGTYLSLYLSGSDVTPNDPVSYGSTYTISIDL